MAILAVLASAVDGGTIRIMLFIMVLVAVALILAGGAIALRTLYKSLKTPNTNESRELR